jgi:hypothetical protein
MSIEHVPEPQMNVRGQFHVVTLDPHAGAGSV